jgi:hypothetical protein
MRQTVTTIHFRFRFVTRLSTASPALIASVPSHLEKKIMKKFAALGLVAAIAFAPVASFAQTATPDASATPAASDTMMKKPMKKHTMKKHHMKKKMMAPAATDTPKS